MLEKLFNTLVEWIESVRPFMVVHAYEQAVLLRWGRFKRVLEPGFHWVIPFVDYAIVQTVVANTMRLLPQNLTTADDQAIAVTGIITFKIVDVRAFLIDVEGGTEAIADTTYGALAEWVASSTLADVRDPSKWARLETKIRRAAKDYGIDVLRFKLSDCVKARAIRLLTNN